MIKKRVNIPVPCVRCCKSCWNCDCCFPKARLVSFAALFPCSKTLAAYLKGPGQWDALLSKRDCTVFRVPLGSFCLSSSPCWVKACVPMTSCGCCLLQPLQALSWTPTTACSISVRIAEVQTFAILHISSSKILSEAHEVKVKQTPLNCGLAKKKKISPGICSFISICISICVLPPANLVTKGSSSTSEHSAT